ncbi:MAG TPA: hypothetical protein VFX56_04875 [Nitrospira sp.]|nr:hypothetical protein [Nitrospira sp.]
MYHSSRTRLCKVVAILVLLAGSMGGPAGAEEDSRAFQLGGSYFKYDGGKFSHYIELRSDGSYRRIARGHRYAEERDYGTWQQSETQKLLLRSDLRFHNINAGALVISMGNRERVKTLPHLRQRIQLFLKEHRAPEFPAEDVERIKASDLIGDLTANAGDIIVLGSKHVSRSDLEKLSGAINRFLSSNQKNLFALTPLEYKASTIFVDDEQAERTKRMIGDELGRVAHSVSTLSKYGYRKIEAAQFHSETKDIQSVRFSPEGNKRQVTLERN